eukprot:scaffold74932_cov31-Tisochrysis_lutea.AAC.1
MALVSARSLLGLLLLGTGVGTAHALVARAPARPRHALPLRARPCSLCAQPEEPLPTRGQADSAPPAPPVPAPRGLRGWMTKWAKFDKEALGKLGVDAFFTYGLVSNLNAGLTISIAWFSFCRKTGLSPLAPGQWPKFLLTYGVIYATLGTVTRPFRMAFSVSMTPLFGRAIKRLQSTLPFAGTRPKLNRTLAIILVSIVGNIVCTCLLIIAGVWTAGIFTGVPAFPPGSQLPFGRGPAV